MSENSLVRKFSKYSSCPGFANAESLHKLTDAEQLHGRDKFASNYMHRVAHKCSASGNVSVEMNSIVKRNASGRRYVQ